MKKNIAIPKMKDQQFDREALRMWKKSSLKVKLEWLESALRFGKLKKL